MSTEQQSPVPLFSNAALENLARNIAGLSKEKQFSVLERFVAICNRHEQQRQQDAATIARLEAKIAYYEQPLPLGNDCLRQHPELRPYITKEPRHDTD